MQEKERSKNNAIENVNLDSRPERERERDLPGMETDAGNYARIGLAKLLDQVPISLKENIRMRMLLYA